MYAEKPLWLDIVKKALAVQDETQSAIFLQELRTRCTRMTSLLIDCSFHPQMFDIEFYPQIC